MQVEGHKNSPMPGKGWVGFLRKSALALACLLLASSIICWVAANWEYASILQKLAGGQLALVALLVAAMLQGNKPGTRNNRNFSVFAHLAGLAALMLGALLALIGQIYQTGADAWSLFLWWLVLLLPWLAVVRTVFLGLLCAVLLNLGLASYLDTVGGWGLFGSASSWLEAGILLVLVNAALLFAWERYAACLGDDWRVGPRVLACAAAGWLLIAALAGLDTQAGPARVLGPGLAACALLYWVYARRLRDLALTSLAAMTAMLLLATGLLPWMESEAALLAVIIVLLVLTGLFLHRLRGQMRKRPTNSDAAAVRSGGDPWSLVLFRLAAMSMTAVLMIAFLVMVLDLGMERLWISGLLACTSGLLVRQTAPGRYTTELGLALAAAGVIMTCAGLYAMDDISPFYRAWITMALGVLLYRWANDSALRFLTAFVVLMVASLLTWPESSRYELLNVSGSGRVWVYFPAYLRVWWLAVAAVLALAVGSRRRDPDFWSPLAWALVCLTQSIAWLAPAPALQGVAVAWVQAPGMVVLWLACAALPVLALGALLRRATGVPDILSLGAPLALAIASLGWMGAPGVSMALLWLTLAYALRRRALLVFGVLALLAYLARFYYQLDSTLLHKSLVLGLTGTWLWVSWYTLGRLARRSTTDAFRQVSSHQAPVPGSDPAALPFQDTPGRLAPRVRAFGLMAGLVGALALANTEIYRNEQILAQGQRVVLALAPVDPRSLMQGDYMDLRYDVAGQVPQVLSKAPPAVAQAIQARRGGYLLLEPDRRGVHRLAAVLADPGSHENSSPAPAGIARGEHPAAAAILAFRLRHDAAQIGTNAWFFPEGQAQRYAGARFGEFRVDKHGTGRLLRLLDEQLQPLAAE